MKYVYHYAHYVRMGGSLVNNIFTFVIFVTSKSVPQKPVVK